MTIYIIECADSRFAYHAHFLREEEITECVTQVEKELMWTLYQKYGSIKEVVKKVKRDRSTVSCYVHEFEAAIGAVSVVLNAKE